MSMSSVDGRGDGREDTALRARGLQPSTRSDGAEPAAPAPAQLLELLDAIREPFTVLDARWTITYVNEAAATQAGQPRDRLIGQNLWELFPQVVGSETYKAYHRALLEKTPVQLEDHLPADDRWFEVSVYPLADGIAASSREITARKRSEELQRRIAAHAAVRADVSATLASKLDVREILQGCCESMVRHLGVSFARIWTTDVAGEALELQASAGKYTHLDGAHRRVPIGKFKIGLIAEERTPHLTNDVLHDPRVGNPEWARREGMVSFAGYPLLVEHRVVGVMAMFAERPLPDDTLSALAGIADAVAQGVERRRAEVALEEHARDLARSNSELEQFAYVASHDLQEPLRMVASYTQLIARRYKGKLDGDADEFIGFAVEGVTRMQRLIQDLLTFSRVGTRTKQFEHVDVERALADAERNLAAAIEESHAMITHDPLPQVEGDSSQLVQLLQNLIGNAIKFRRHDAPKIHVSARRAEGELVFSVKDDGIGIAPEYFDRIFVIFQRLHNRTQYDGTGIGLSICKKIVERHGGKMSVESKLGEGSTFVFTLPSTRVSQSQASRRS